MNCIIIEDELPAQRILKNYISKMPELVLQHSFQSALEANTVLQKGKIDVVFLDINLPDISGIQYIKTLTAPPAIIMTTAYHEHAVESFELDTICDYLVKPISFSRFLKAVNKVKKQLNGHNPISQEKVVDNDAFFLNIDKTLHKVNISDILFIASDKNYVTVVTKKGKYSYLESLKNWMEKLPPEHFIQVHKSYIVNFAAIEKINGNLLYVNQEKIPLGRSYKPALVKKLNLG